MKKIILFLTIIITIFHPSFLSGHVKHYNNLKYLEYEIYLNNELIGSHAFNFEKDKNILSVTTNGKFKVKKLGIDLMNYSTKTTESYVNGKLNNYISETFQNDKRKYVILTFNKAKKHFEIDGSSYDFTFYRIDCGVDVQRTATIASKIIKEVFLQSDLTRLNCNTEIL